MANQDAVIRELKKHVHKVEEAYDRISAEQFALKHAAALPKDTVPASSAGSYHDSFDEAPKGGFALKAVPKVKPRPAGAPKKAVPPLDFSFLRKREEKRLAEEKARQEMLAKKQMHEGEEEEEEEEEEEGETGSAGGALVFEDDEEECEEEGELEMRSEETKYALPASLGEEDHRLYLEGGGTPPKKVFDYEDTAGEDSFAAGSDGGGVVF